MKKSTPEKLNWKRFRHNLLRRKKVKHENTSRYKVRIKIEKRKISAIKKNRIPVLYKYLYPLFYNDSYLQGELIAPEIFCLDRNNDESLIFIKSVYTCLYSLMISKDLEHIQLSFKSCKELNLGSLMIINVFITDFLKWRKKMINIGLPKSHVPYILLDDDMSDKINNLLSTMHFPVKVKNNTSIPYPGFRLIEGVAKKNSFIDNSKGKISKSIRKYIDNSIKLFGAKLSYEGVNLFDNMIGEILANADDHSSIDRWYIYGSLTIHSKDVHNPIGELNLIILNFGPSFYEGFYKTRNQNAEMYNEMLSLYENVINTQDLKSKFPLESMVTLYGLQEGYSRLKHIDASRGTGTMNFIQAFSNLGMSSDTYNSELYLLTGKTLIKCDHKYTPFSMGSRFYLSLNQEQNLSLPPDPSHITTMKETFPGTILLTKTYLDKTHLDTKIDAK